MLRVALAFAALLFGSQLVAAPPPEKVVNLNTPGVLEKLAQTNPAHHQKILAILSGVMAHKVTEVPHWLQTTFAARNVEYRALMLASNPPKRDLSFVLDDTSYETRVTLTDIKPEVIDVRHGAHR
jgi:hypothetical protein